MKKKIFSAVCFLSVVGLLLPLKNTWGKDTQQPQDQIIVTAQKVEENVQEVPISMSLLDEFAIEDNNIRTISDIGLYVPNLQQFSVGGAGMYTPGMRGLTADVHTASSTVATYVDGIPYLSSMGNDVVLEDIERVEVLRGPQGTLYGKNAYSGVINIITKSPGDQTRGKIKIELGQDNKREYTFNVSGPLVKNKFYGGICAKHYEKDGFIRNEYLNKMDDGRKDDTIKLYLKYTPMDRLAVSLISTWLEKDDGATTIMPLAAPDPKKTYSNLEGYTKSKSRSHALKLEYLMDNMAFSSVTTYKRYDDKRAIDYDYSPADISHVKVDSRYKDYSQEFRLNGRTGRIQWLGGLYLDKNNEDPFHTRNGMPATDSTTESDSIGIFANIDYPLGNDFVLTSGIRYDQDNIETNDRLKNYANDKSYSEISPKIGLKYTVNQHLFSYATVSKGYKRGGYFMLAPADLKSYDKETLWNYEIGVKTSLFDDKLLFNMSIFYMDIEDMQVATNLTPLSAYISNAAKATSKGLELETAYQAFKYLTLFANLGYAKTQFDKFSDNLGDYSNNDNPFAPRYNYSLGFKYRDNRGIFGKFDINGQGSFYADKANQFESKSATIINAKIGYETDQYEIYVYGNNITDEAYNIDGYFNYYTLLSSPREIGIQMAYRF